MPCVGGVPVSVRTQTRLVTEKSLLPVRASVSLKLEKGLLTREHPSPTLHLILARRLRVHAKAEEATVEKPWSSVLELHRKGT